MGLNAELELSAPHCDPKNALVDPPESGVSLMLEHPGSVHWIKVTRPGTYTFHANPKNRLPAGTDNGVVYKVYLPTDLSRPIGSNHGESQQVVKRGLGYPYPNFTYQEMKYHVIEAPFYVKVFAPGDGSPIGYDFYYHRNTCTSRDDACEVVPFERDETKQADRVLFPKEAPYDAWYSFHVDRSDGNPATNAQTLRVFATEEFASQPRLQQIDVFPDGSSTSIWGSTNSVVTTIGGAQRRTLVLGPSANGVLDGNNRKFFLRIKRGTTVNPPVDFHYWLGWETNLRWLRGGAVFCDEAQEGGWLQGHDEIWMQVWADSWGLPGGTNDWAGIQDGFNVGDDFKADHQGEWAGPFLAGGGSNFHGELLRGEGAAKFVNRLDIQLGEDDAEFDESQRINNIQTGLAAPGKAPIKKVIWFRPGSGEYRVELVVTSHVSEKLCTSNSDCQAPGTCIHRRCN
jgi:hypothetical protein